MCAINALKEKVELSTNMVYAYIWNILLPEFFHKMSERKSFNMGTLVYPANPIKSMIIKDNECLRKWLRQCKFCVSLSLWFSTDSLIISSNGYHQWNCDCTTNVLQKCRYRSNLFDGPWNAIFGFSLLIFPLDCSKYYLSFQIS